ncbi:hypothetical protein OUZ56_003864 [Daphnia magna]|uniref:Uncharacterized protein n=1 Tax=Daphnia magna TaxID=35525 RepID=A0ABQ9YND3_9CRUS|nr:hypothetical protein OUZ56_003864 [Daphnia magna]
MALCMTEITSDKLNGVCYVNLFCVSNDFSSNNLRLLFVCGGVLPCQPLNQQPAFLLSMYQKEFWHFKKATIPYMKINIQFKYC